MKKSKIKKKFKSKATLFVCSFLFLLFFVVITNKFFGFRKGDTYGWDEFFSPLLILCSLGFASWMTWVAFDEWGNV